MRKELDSFFRRVKLRAHFGKDDRKQKVITEEDIFKPASTWEPQHVHHTVNTFCAAIIKESGQKNNTRKPQSNLSKEEIKALNELQSRDDIIITKADNGCKQLHK